ncbi:MAG: hypothetical protein F6K54_05515 [Okeania sp. SIO3B5]|uniref:hypothetical protein n=1 Tax=Okeania sp. SIO3B5 TaxID=2607811 RepID=UPI0013FEF151|nr:hypothetical protein [Okeania sp. SIO3B5]NEO52577.1 hypothetical protein [Okeania sp. SIO3B5]
MLLKSQTIIKQEELVSILEAQLKKAKSRLTELTKADTKIKSVVAELESLLTEHPDYKLLVSDRLKLGESEADQTGPVRIEIESVGKTAEYTESEIEAYDSLFGDGPPQTAPKTEEIITEHTAQILENTPEPIESPYSSEAEIAPLIEAHDQLSQRNQPTEQEISAWDSGHEQVQSVVSPIQSDEEEKIALVEKVLSELDTFEFSKTRGIPKIAMYIEIKGKSLGMIFTDKGNLLSTIELEENLIRTYALDLPLLLKDVNEGKSITLDNYCLSKKSEVGKVQQQNKPTAKATVETLKAADVEQVEDESMVQKPEPTLSQLKEQLLSKKNKSELEEFKASIGAPMALKIWESCTHAERNLIKCINVVADSKRAALPFDLVGWHNALGKLEIARYVGFYLYGKQVEDSKRVIYLVKHDTFKIVDKRSLKGVDAKSQKPCPTDLVIKLEAALQAQPEPEQPTAEEIASNNFTGLEPTPKQNGSENGKQQDFSQSEQSDVVQTELYLKVEQPAPSKKTEVIPTPLLETVAGEIKKVNPELTFGYDSNGKSTFLTVYHGTSYIGIFEDDGVDLYSSNTAKMLHHGFTEEMIDALIEIELSPKV